SQKTRSIARWAETRSSSVRADAASIPRPGKASPLRTPSAQRSLPFMVPLCYYGYETMQSIRVTSGSSSPTIAVMNDVSPPGVDWRGVRAYIGLAFGLPWCAEFIALARGVRFESLTIGATALLAGVMLTPALSAFIVRKWITREGFASAGLRFGPWRPYVAVWIGMPLVVIGIYALTVLLWLGPFHP